MKQFKFHINDVVIKIWYLLSKGKKYYHQSDGYTVKWTDGTKLWYANGKLHRIDGPAMEWADGSRTWWTNGKLHRIDGPAIEFADERKEWWINGKLLPIKEVEEWIKENKINLKTEAGQIAFKLRWL